MGEVTVAPVSLAPAILARAISCRRSPAPDARARGRLRFQRRWARNPMPPKKRQADSAPAPDAGVVLKPIKALRAKMGPKA